MNKDLNSNIEIHKYKLKNLNSKRAYKFKF